MSDYGSTDDILNDKEIMTDSEQSAPAETSEAVTSAPSQDQEYEYTARGKTIKEPISMILKRASQGYDYAQVMSEHNKKTQEFDQRFKTYEQINDYASKNAEWWNHVTQSYQSKESYQPQVAQSATPAPQLDHIQSPDLKPVLEPITKDLNEVKQFIREQQAEKEQARREQDDAKLTGEMESIRKDYPHVDFTKIDEKTGKTLEYKVLEHGVQNGIRNFKTAFRDFYHDELIKRARDEGKDLTIKESQKKTKLGLLGETPTPTKQSADLDYSKLSYNRINDLVMRDLGIR